MKAKGIELITRTIIDQIETHGTGWIKPFAAGAGQPTNACTGAEYNGINRLMLTIDGGEHYATYKQWQKVGGQVRKGSGGKGVPVVFYKTIEREDENGETRQIPMLRFSTVYSVACVDGWEAPARADQVDLTERLDSVDRYVKNLDADITHTDNGRACYRPGIDQIEMPNRELFSATETSTATECYYSTLLHELTHWTGNAARLNRLKATRFGDDDYAFEELVAELGAAYQCHDLGISPEPRPDHAQYLAGWLKILKADSRAILRAAAAAQKATDYLNAICVN